MPSLNESLTRLESVLRLVGALVARHLQPGLDRGTISDRLHRLGLAPSEELVQWFMWHNGAGSPSSSSVLESELAPGVYFFDLDTLCQEYTDARRDFDYVANTNPDPHRDSSELWSPSWFPLARLDAGWVAIDLADGPTESSPVHAGWFDVDRDARSHPRWETVEAFVRHITSNYEKSIYEVDSEGHVRGPDVDLDTR